MFGTTEAMRVFVVVLILGNALALLAGLSLLIVPQRVVKWLGLLTSNPLSMRRVTKRLEVTHDSERAMLRYPRALGVALLAGGGFILIKLSLFIAAVSVVDGGLMLRRLFPNSQLSAPLWQSLWSTTLAVVLIGAVLAVLIGGLALLRVQTLKKLSSLTNRWVSTRQAAKPVSRPYYGIDQLVGKRPQAWGGVITLLALYTLVMILWFARGVMG